MQLREFKTILANLGAALAGEEAKIVSALSAAMPNRTGTLAAFLGAVRVDDSGVSGSNQGLLIADALPILERAEALVVAIAKQAIVGDYKLLLTWARERAHLPLATLAQPAPGPVAGATATVRETVVREHAERLKGPRPGTKAFGDALETLMGDRRVRKQEMVAIARMVVDPDLAASTTKPAALKRIRLSHDAYLDSAARSGAISAARPPRS